MRRDDVEDVLWCLSKDLSDEVVLNVHLVVGSEFAVFVDSGISVMYDDLLALVDRAGVGRSAVRLVLNTHSHHDHIGCNGRLKTELNCLVAAPQAYANWHGDFDNQYNEFANAHPDIIGDSPEQRRGILATLDLPHHVDLHLTEGSVVSLGGGVELTCLELPGHMSSEVGFLEHKTGVLLLGDVLSGTKWSFFHGYVNVPQYRQTLTRLSRIMASGEVSEVHAGHYPVLAPAQCEEVLTAIGGLMDDVEEEIGGIIAARGSATRATIWTSVCDNMAKARDFRALNVVNAHLEDLVGRLVLVEDAPDRFCYA
jgi:glyoxylase-like metal-dependent hydrolase (beta-lactamase superfamily II)